jgi:hypothetical protein
LKESNLSTFLTKSRESVKPRQLGVSDTTEVRFATLMRLLCRQNDGTFVDLSRL